MSSVNENTFKLVGKLSLNLQIPNSFYKFEVYVSPRTPWDLLLGVHFLRELDMKIYFQSDVLKIPQPVCVFCNSYITIPAFTEKTIVGVFKQGTQADVSGTITGKSVLWKKGMSCTNAYVTIKKGKKTVPIRIANLTGETQTLFPKTPLAYFVVAEGTETCHDLETLISETTSWSKNLPIHTSVNLCKHTEPHLNTFNLPFNFNTSLSLEEKYRLTNLLHDYQDVFQKPNQPLGPTSVLKHKIKLIPGAEPFRSVPYRITPLQREEVNRQVQEMLKQGIIVESDSPYSSPVLLVKKADCSQRFVVDMRKLNNITDKDSFPLIRIDDALDSLSGSRYFAT